MTADELYAQAKKVYDSGDTAGSVALFEQAREAFVADNKRSQAANVANDLGVVYYLTGNRNKATEILRAALAELEQAGDGLGQAKATGNLGQLMLRAGDKAGAEKNYMRAGELFHQVGEHHMEYDTYRALSQMQMQSGRWLEALASYDLALAAKGGSGALRWFLQIPLKILKLR